MIINTFNPAEAAYAALQLNADIQNRPLESSSFGRDMDSYAPSGLAYDRAFSALGISQPTKGEYNLSLMRGQATLYSNTAAITSGGATIAATMSALAGYQESIQSTSSSLFQERTDDATTGLDAFTTNARSRSIDLAFGSTTTSSPRRSAALGLYDQIGSIGGSSSSNSAMTSSGSSSGTTNSSVSVVA